MTRTRLSTTAATLAFCEAQIKASDTAAPFDWSSKPRNIRPGLDLDSSELRFQPRRKHARTIQDAQPEIEIPQLQLDASSAQHHPEPNSKPASPTPLAIGFSEAPCKPDAPELTHIDLLSLSDDEFRWLSAAELNFQAQQRFAREIQKKSHLTLAELENENTLLRKDIFLNSPKPAPQKSGRHSPRASEPGFLSDSRAISYRGRLREMHAACGIGLETIIALDNIRLACKLDHLRKKNTLTTMFTSPNRKRKATHHHQQPTTRSPILLRKKLVF